MKIEVIAIINEMTNWCLINHSDTFTCDLHFRGHVNWLQINLISGGYENKRKDYNIDYISVNKKNSLEYLNEFFQEMKEFKKEHDEWFSEDNMKKLEEDKKKARLVRLKEELASLES